MSKLEIPIDHLQEVQLELASLDAKGGYTKFGLNTDEAKQYLADVLRDHDIGTTARSLLIYVKGWLARNQKTFDDIKDDDSIREEFTTTLTSSSSVSRVVPNAIVANEHLGGSFDVVTLGGGRGHAAQMFLATDLFDGEFFTETNRCHLDSANRPDVEKVISVDRQEPTFEQATQIYTGFRQKMDVYNELESRDDHGGRFVKIVSDIRDLVADQLEEHLEPSRDVLICLNNVLYQLAINVRAQVMDAVDNLAIELRKTGRAVKILSMDQWRVTHNTKPEVTIPGAQKPFANPSFIRIGDRFDDMETVAELDGSTGKPFRYKGKDGNWYFHKVDGSIESAA